MIKLGLIVNCSTRAYTVDVNKIKAYIESRGAACYVLGIRKEGFELMENFTDLSDLPEDVRAVFAFGGDGTIIQAARELSSRNVPIVGVNLGTVGFLAEVEISDIYSAIDAVISGTYKVEERFMIRGRVIKEGKTVYEANALNDIVLARGGLVRAMSLSVHIDGELMNSYYCDGVIVTTPTGSTGYNLSAGGEVIMPNAEVLGIQPICPHSLNSRGVIIPSSSEVNITVEWRKKSEPAEAVVSFDGNKGIILMPGNSVSIVKSSQTVPFLRFNEFKFFDKMREKFLDV